MSALGKRYAEALLSLAIKENKVQKIKEDIDLAKELFSSLNISLDIKHVGPSIGDNYLLVFDIASRRNITKYFKQTIIQTLIYGIIATLVLIFVF